MTTEPDKALSVRARLEFLSKALREHGAKVQDLQVWAHECTYHADDIDDMLALSSGLSRKLQTATGLLERYRELYPPSMGDSLDSEEELDESARHFLSTLTEKES